MKVFDDDGTELIKCKMCNNGQWQAACCNGAGGCSCRGDLVEMGMCNVCNGTGWRREDADVKANIKTIKTCFIGSGPRTGYWAGK